MARKFEWDPNKDKKNRKKHGISFQEATSVFDDDKKVTKQDTRFDYGEDRFNTTGSAFGKLWSVIWTPRSERKRLISARRANKQEKNRYNG